MNKPWAYSSLYIQTQMSSNVVYSKIAVNSVAAFTLGRCNFMWHAVKRTITLCRYSTPSIIMIGTQFLFTQHEPSKETSALIHAPLPGREVPFVGTDGNIVVVFAVILLCSAGQSFAHQFDMLGILLSGKDDLFRDRRLFTKCQEGYCIPTFLKGFRKLSDNNSSALPQILANNT